MDKKEIQAALALIVVAIILGAFGAHGLKPKLDTDQLNSYHTGVNYQLWNGIVLLLIATTGNKITWSKLGTVLIWLGVGLFSGSIYCIIFSQIQGFTFPKFFYLLTPIGGTSIITGYLVQIFKVKIN